MPLVRSSPVLPLLVAFAAAQQAPPQQPPSNPVGKQDELVAYRQAIGDTGVAFDLVPIRGGTFTMGSPADEAGRDEEEGPQVQVELEPFWMGKLEVMWAEYDLWVQDSARPQSKKPDGMSRPTPPYMDLTFNMGRDGYPAICMSHTAARQYCKWLSDKTGRFYRLPTEAEWEYAARAGSTAAYGFGADSKKLGDVAWFAGNSARELEPGTEPVQAYHRCGTKQGNAWGLFDMHGNVAEWVADHWLDDAYAPSHGDGNGKAPRKNPFFVPPRDDKGRPVRFPHVVRGGSWRDPAERLRCAARQPSDPVWNLRDPQGPKSWWYLTEGQHVGFRVVRPLRAPTAEERAAFEAL